MVIFFLFQLFILLDLFSFQKLISNSELSHPVLQCDLSSMGTHLILKQLSFKAFIELDIFLRLLKESFRMRLRRENVLVVR
mmetsp:Transcript_10915/g.11059  ORF Transcript_10915/g.11059 Transcript_10915/m.11059 type:complete len:81 (+) Transcript_10915:1233-1475(+)